MPQHETHNLEGAKGAYCRVCAMYIYLFIGLSGFTIQSTIVYGVNLFTMPGMQRVVYAKSSKVLAAAIVVYCLLSNPLRGDSPIVSSAFQ